MPDRKDTKQSELLTLLAFAIFAVVVLGISYAPPQAHAADDESSLLRKGSIALGYQNDSQTAPYRTAVASADTDDETTWSGIAEFGLLGRPNLLVSGRFSGTTSDTATIKVAYYHKTTLDGVDTLNYKGSSSVVTLTALAGLDDNGDNEAPIVGFDGRGSNMIKVIVLSISAGNIDLWVGSH